jgi:hypothetical protein
MDQSIGLSGLEHARAVERLAAYIATSVKAAEMAEAPFYHLVFERVFPDDVYAAMLDAMPVTTDYRRMHGRRKNVDVRADGTPTRVKIDLFPEYIRNLPPEQRALWDVVGRALCAEEVKAAFVQRLARPLERRFGAGFDRVGLYPLPILTRDVPGYKIHPHTDTRSKGITVQLYLPRDASAAHVGTIFHARNADGTLSQHTQMKFAPNSGYAFAVGDDTWHSADPVGTEVTTRDSILLTYYVDAGMFRFLQNRTKRLGNFVGNELRHRLRG